MPSRITVWLIIVLTLVSIYIDLPKFDTSAKITTPEVKIKFINFTIPKSEIKIQDYLDKFPLKLGLDLQGGSQLVLQTDMGNIRPEDRDSALESSKEIIEKRVNLFGVSESLVQTSKVGETRRILVELPGVKDASRAAELVGRTAQLEFRELPATSSAQTPELVSTGLTGKDLKKAQVSFGNSKNAKAGAEVAIQFTNEGAKKFAEITKRNVGKPLAIFLDQNFISAPVVQQEIVGGNAVITGNFTSEQAKALSIQLNAGALPVPIKIVDQRVLSASLGQESIQKSVLAGAIGLVTVIFYMIFYYRVLGGIASLVLVVYSLFVLAIFKTGLFLIPPVTLTLPGIAGFILSIGMAVDANILIFERMKEEKRWGKGKTVALEQGFKRAWSSIRDSNISTLMTAGILFIFGTGMVKGFAITLAIGVLVSMFTAITVTRTILKLIIK